MEPRNLEERVTALETQVHQLDGRVRANEQNTAAARILAGAADRDVADLSGELRDFRRATVTSFNALREDMTDLRGDVTGLREDMTTGLAGLREDMTTGFAEIRGEMTAGQQHVVRLIEGLAGDQGGNGPDQR